MKKLVILAIVAGIVYLLVGVCAWHIMPGKIADAENKRMGVTMALSKIANDQLDASRRISEITRLTLGSGRDKVAQVSMLLSDTELNRLALTYMGADWAILHSSFTGNVKHMRDLLTMQKADRKKCVSRLNQKIKELEQEKKRLLTESVPTYGAHKGSGAGIANFSQRQWHLKLEEVDRQLWAYRASNTYREYLSKDDTDQNEVEAKAKNEAAIFKLASDYETQTVQQLVAIMAEKASSLRYEEAEPERLRHQMSYFNIWPLNLLSKMPTGD